MLYATILYPESDGHRVKATCPTCEHTFDFWIGEDRKTNNKICPECGTTHRFTTLMEVEVMDMDTGPYQSRSTDMVESPQSTALVDPETNQDIQALFEAVLTIGALMVFGPIVMGLLGKA